jgi:hypothetical protein
MYDSQVLLDPLKKEFHLPSAFVNESYRERWKGEVISQDVNRFFLQGSHLCLRHGS